MEVLFFCPRWGSEHIDWEDWFSMVKDAGYQGVEWAIGRNVTSKEMDKVWTAADRRGIKMIAQHFDTTEADFSIHLSLYQSWLEKIKPFPVVKVNSQTGRDIFNFGENKQLIDAALDSGLPVVHETHRGRFSFAAHLTRIYFLLLHDIRITLDVSHWYTVAESYLEDQPEALKIAVKRTDHIHARVGYTQGPQVTDPRNGFWAEALERHLTVWDRIAEQQREHGVPLTITPEFGPFPYMVHDPVDGLPVASQWGINIYMMELLKKRYAGY